MDNIELVKEDAEVELGVKTLSVEIPLRVKMVSYDKSPFEFTTSIDEQGQIILTPLSKSVEFISANTDNNVEYDLPIREQETVINCDDNEAIKETSIILYTTVLSETDNVLYSADIDEIGQCVVYPLDKTATFLTVTLEDSLNLITEDIKEENYFGYTLINTGDGWDIKDSDGKLVEEGVATLHEARIIVCQEELHRLTSNSMDEELIKGDSDKDSSKESDSEEDTDKQDESEKDVEPDVTAELVENIDVESVLKKLTEDYTESCGMIRCSTNEELKQCSFILSEHYSDVSCCDNNGICTIAYSNDSNTYDSYDNMDIILRFLQGDMDLITEKTGPSENLKHIEELDTEDNCYYYDEDNDVMICYLSIEENK